MHITGFFFVINVHVIFERSLQLIVNICLKSHLYLSVFIIP